MVVLAWGYLIYTGNIATLWPLFGTGNQLLATIALAVGTAFLVNMGKARYAFITAIPMLFVGVTTLTAGIQGIANIFWPLTRKPETAFQGYLDTILMVLFVTGVVLVLVNVAVRCWRAAHGESPPGKRSVPPPPRKGYRSAAAKASALRCENLRCEGELSSLGKRPPRLAPRSLGRRLKEKPYEA